MSYPLTKRQSKVYEFIRECISNKRYSPTLHEVASKFGFKNHSTAQFYVNTLIKKRWISREKGKQIELGSY